MLFPHTESKRISLAPATAADASYAYDVLLRLGRPGLPLLDDFRSGFGQGLTAAFLIRARGSDDVVGLGRLGERALAGHLRVELDLLAGQADGSASDATLLLTNYAFAMWRLRKVYFHTVDGPSGLGFGAEHAEVVQTESVLPEYTYLHGELRDVHVLAIDRAAWDVHGAGFVERIIG